MSDEKKDKIIGGCRIIRKVGEGGMGIVYEAEQISLGRKVACKLLPAKFQKDEDYEKRFVREARSAARINHPNVVQVYNAGREGNNLYLVMEFVDGITLQKKVLESPFLAPKEIAGIVKDISLALYEAEKRKIVHRDMKPANIMITSGGILKVMDFGLAKQTDTATHLTAAGKLLGTPFYMSPEQINGEEIDSRSDLYSTGIVLYFMITKKKPFTGDLYTVIQHQLNSPRPDPKEINPDVPEFLRRLYFKMTKKDRFDRFQSFNDVAKEIDKTLLKIAPSAIKAPLQDEGTIAVSRKAAFRKKEQKEEPVKKTKTAFTGKKIFITAGVFSVLIMIGLFIFSSKLKKKQNIISSKETSLASLEEKSSQVVISQKNQVDDGNKKPATRLRFTGANFVRENIEQKKVYYRLICSDCKNIEQDVKDALRPESGRKRFSLHNCKSCGKKQLIIIENPE